MPTWGDRRIRRVGLLGGSFNPAHAGHRHIAQLALRRFGLDQVWLLVSPGNPLKPRSGMAPLATRFGSAGSIADGRRIIATGIEARLGTRYTVDTLRLLRTRFPRAKFVWLMGADNLAQLPRWQGWREIVHTMPFAVLPRPAYNLRARGGTVAHRLRRHRVADRDAHRLADARAPAWSFPALPQHPGSATAIRRAYQQTTE